MKVSAGILCKALAITAVGSVLSAASVGFAADPVPALAAGQRLNVLLITADDMNFDTPDVVRGIAPDVTPNIDRLAHEGMRFVNAHVTVAVCQPSRETLMTGRYPHRSGAIGFVPVNADCPTLEESLHTAGYHLGILGKVVHLAPPEKFPWDYKHDADDLGMGRDPALYYKYATEFFAEAKGSHHPFFLMANSHDPHRPFAGSDGDDKANARPADVPRASGKPGDAVTPMKHPDPARTYRPDEVRVPGFLPDLPDVRKELAQYASSSHRCDESLGQVLKVLKESGMEENTVVIFLSDNGMSIPFAKQNCYLTSTRTPLIVRWPGHVKAGVVNTEDFVAAGIDFMPTVLDITHTPPPAGMDGRSFLPLLEGQKQEGRDHVFTVYNDTVRKFHLPMCCVQDAHFGYIYNAWSDGKTEYDTDTIYGLTFPAMKEAAKENTEIAERVRFYLYRVPEELYDFEHDPDALHNLIDDPKYQKEVADYRKQLATWMHDTQDPLESQFRAQIESKKPN